MKTMPETEPSPNARPLWLLRRPSDTAETVLFCLPYLGTGASLFYRWPRLFGTVEVCPVQLPGRETRLRENPYTSHESLAGELAEGLLPFIDRPFAFFGHCASAYIAFETCLRLVEGGGPTPARLFVSSMVPPHEAPDAPVLKLDEDGLVSLVRNMMMSRGVEPIPEMLDMAVEAMRSDLAAYGKYRPQRGRGPGCHMTVFGWSGDTYVPHLTTRGWSEYGQVRNVLLEGDHWSFLDAPEGLRREVIKDLGGG